MNTRDVLFGILCGWLGAEGRDEALLGTNMGDVWRAFAHMAPERDCVHAYFEIPLIGKPNCDVHCSVNSYEGLGSLPADADASWAKLYSWYAGLDSAEMRDHMTVGATVDMQSYPDVQPGLYLVQRDKAEAVVPFLELLGEQRLVPAWKTFQKHLPLGWETTYTGLFPGRANGLLRVNAHPARENAMEFADALTSLDIPLGAEELDLCRTLAEGPTGFDLQLDVDESGKPAGDFSLETYLEGAPVSGSYQKTDYAKRVFSLMEACGAADDRWKHLDGIDVSKRIALPGLPGNTSCGISLRIYSAKLRFVKGSPILAKAYLRGDAKASTDQRC